VPSNLNVVAWNTAYDQNINLGVINKKFYFLVLSLCNLATHVVNEEFFLILYFYVTSDKTKSFKLLLLSDLKKH
jgi:hypothetical protein